MEITEEGKKRVKTPEFARELQQIAKGAHARSDGNEPYVKGLQEMHVAVTLAGRPVESEFLTKYKDEIAQVISEHVKLL